MGDVQSQGVGTRKGLVGSNAETPPSATNGKPKPKGSKDGT
jgi:hypothetical protein